MLNIGIDKSHGLVFEGQGGYGRLVSPTPVITPVKIFFESEGELSAESSSNEFGWRFREDSYDPISRIRRGRFYEALGGGQPQEWTIQAHPVLSMSRGGSVANRARLYTFNGRTIYHNFIKGRTEQPIVTLGMDDRYTIWSVLSVEATSTGEDLVTLKARTSLGVLPEINYEKFSKRYRGHVQQCMETCLNEVYRSAPVSVIDRARDAASQILIAFFELEGGDARDLGKLTRRLEGEGRSIAASSAKIIARLHARAKPVEVERRKMRPIMEQDGELAVQCLGALCCELGLAEWL